MSALPIYFETRLVGRIDVGADGPSFAYNPAWLETRGAFPLSVTMRLSPRRKRGIHPTFRAGSGGGLMRSHERSI
jgi:HipA-like protein